MSSTAEHIAARHDYDLRQRLVAAAEQSGLPNAEEWVDTNIGALITAPISGTDTITSVHAYAKANYDSAQATAAAVKRPGLDPSAVLDAYLNAAVAAVKG